MEIKIPAILIKDIYFEWVQNYGQTFPLYGNDTVRHDISGSVRPLLSSTEIPHTKVLAERSGFSRKQITKIIEDENLFLAFDMVDKLLTAMDMEWKWYWPPLDQYYG